VALSLPVRRQAVGAPEFNRKARSARRRWAS
jgi:hypothetical protein